MTGSNNPLSENCRNPRRDLRGPLAGARSANPSRVDLLGTPAARNDDNDTSASSTSTGGLFSYLRDEASFVANRARDDAQGTLHGAHGEAHSRGASGRLEVHRVTAPCELRASITRKTAPPPDAPQHQGATATTRRRSAEAAELLSAPALGATATAGPQRLRSADGFTRLPVGLLAGRRYSHAASTARYDWSEGSRSGSARPSSTARTWSVADPEASSASRIISGMRAASVSSVYPLPSVRSAQRSSQPPSSTDAVTSPRREVPDDTLERLGAISHAAADASRAPTRGDVGALRAHTRGGDRTDIHATAAVARAGARLAGGDTWRAPAVAYNAVERRIGRDATALRAVSARLDAAATAIDAVEVGVRSASDSLDSLLHLLESRPVAVALSASSAEGVAERSTTSASTPEDSHATAVADSDGVATQAGGAGSATGMRATHVVSTGSSSSVARSAAYAARGATVVAGDLSGGAFALAPPPSSSVARVVPGAVRSGALPAANTEPAPASYGMGSDAGGESRALPRVVQRETAVSTPPGGRLGEDGGAEDCAGHAAIALAQRGAAARAELTARATVIVKAEEEPRPMRDDCERFVSPSHSPEPSVALEGNSQAAGRGVAEQELRRRGSLGGEASAGCPWRAGPAHAERAPRPEDDGSAVEAATSGAAPFLSRGDGTPSEEDRSRSSDEEVGSGWAVPGGSGTSDAVVQADLAAAGTGMNAARESRRSPRRSDASLPVLELEAAMDGIDAERGRLILEIVRLRGQQNESLIHLQQLQHEQFVVRQRQVSTLSDIVNSFGRTVEAAGALPHGEDSSLGRISGDVVSTLRRMLRLLSATVPVAAESAARATSGATRAGLPLSPSLTPGSATLSV
ncbi:unnamed protein product, partial [Laminaria digitata]